MAFAEVMELTTGTEKHHQEVEMEEEEDQVVGLERKTSSLAHEKRPDSADSSTITTTNTSSSSSFSGDGERVTIESLEIYESAEKEIGFHGEHDDVNNGNVYLDVHQGSESSDAESDDHESHTVDHLNGKKKVTEFEKGSSSEENKGSREIDEVQDDDIPEEVEVIEEEEVDIEHVKDYKAKELVENQKTPDLLCPKCKNCITKVVVLKKRVLLRKKVALKKNKQNNPNVPERPAATRPTGTDDNLRSEDNMKSAVSSENPIPGSFFYKCLSCFSIFNIEPIVVGSNPVPPSEVNVGINTRLKPQQEPTGCSNWIVSMIGIKKNEQLEDKGEAMPSVPEDNRPRDNHTPLVVDTAAPPPVQDDAVTLIQDKVRLSPIQPQHDVNVPKAMSSGPSDSRVDIRQLPVTSLLGETPADPLLPQVVERRKPEILKSVVYGGLTEAITSLGVISSAAGSGASTLNILVLGLANLFGGLILIIHNLQELREEEPIIETTDDNGEEETRYKRLLGRRENFMLHATLAILSFIITGLLPPVVYYFSFRETHNKDYKVASVFSASLICISFLALAKAHVRSPRGSYLKSVLYYAANAVSVSGITYVVGNVVNQLLEKYGWSDGLKLRLGR
ncbi:membrane protein of ER body-like protein [Brassica napus]|uniref:membrane protein of ER body-like protein n=1 Tax=Brassica napus TaxID=3708 RepID=UPI000BBEB5E8|nr:membrane protein of ER body-like protein [Brassica napus]